MLEYEKLGTFLAMEAQHEVEQKQDPEPAPLRNSIKSSKSQRSAGKQGSNPSSHKMPSYKAEGSVKSKRASSMHEARKLKSIEEVKAEVVEAQNERRESDGHPVDSAEKIENQFKYESLSKELDHLEKQHQERRDSKQISISID